MIMHDKCEQIWRDAYGKLSKKKEHKMYIYHSLQMPQYKLCTWAYGKKHLAGSQN